MPSKPFGVRLAIPAILLLISLTGCGSPSGDSGPYDMLVWQCLEKDPDNPVRSAFADVDERLDGIRISVRYVAPETIAKAMGKAVEGGTGPDLLVGPVSLIPGMADGRLITWLDFRKHTAKDEYPLGTWDMVTHGNHQYALPLSVETVALAFNMDFVPVPPRSTRALAEKAKELVGAGRIGLAGSFLSPTYTFPLYSNLVGNADSRETYLGLVEGLAWSSGSFPGKPSESEEAALASFNNEEAAMCLVSQRSFWALMDSNVNAGVVPLPKVSGVKADASPVLRGNVVMVSAFSEDKQLGARVAALFTQSAKLDPYFRAIKQLPAAKSQYGSYPYSSAIGKGFLESLGGRLKYTYGLRSGQTLLDLKGDLAFRLGTGAEAPERQGAASGDQTEQPRPVPPSLVEPIPDTVQGQGFEINIVTDETIGQ